jgi:hypothetical protein
VGPAISEKKERERLPFRDAGDAGPSANSVRGLKRSPRPFSPFPFYFIFFFYFSFEILQNNFKLILNSFLTFVNYFPCLLHFREMFESHNSQRFW